MVQQMDAGDMLEVVKVPIGEEMTFGELNEKMCEAANFAIHKVIQDFKNGSVVKVPQDESAKTFAAKITPEDEEIHWEKDSRAIHQQIRALSPFPGAWTKINLGEEVKRLKIKQAKRVEGNLGEPGTLVFGKNEWSVACGRGVIRLLRVQLEGKKEMEAGEFFRGVQGKSVKFGVR
jgi:methionyl-tRNA formyltransferase